MKVLLILYFTILNRLIGHKAMEKYIKVMDRWLSAILREEKLSAQASTYLQMDHITKEN